MRWKRTENLYLAPGQTAFRLPVLMSIAALLVPIAVRPAEPLLIATAANFAPVLKTMKPSLESTCKCKAKIITASTGKLATQIKHGAPFHLFFSADSVRAHQVAEWKNIPMSGIGTYAIGKLVFFSKKLELHAGLVFADSHNWKNFKIAIADPQLAPYGLAAKHTLLDMGLWHQMVGELIVATNVSQLFQYTLSGNVDFCFTALSQVMPWKNDSSHVVEVPANRYPPIIQKCVLLKPAEQAAIAVFAYVLSPAGQHIIQTFGYQTRG